MKYSSASLFLLRMFFSNMLEHFLFGLRVGGERHARVARAGRSLGLGFVVQARHVGAIDGGLGGGDALLEVVAHHVALAFEVVQRAPDLGQVLGRLAKRSP